jgi:hypothetical protein
VCHDYAKSCRRLVAEFFDESRYGEAFDAFVRVSALQSIGALRNRPRNRLFTGRARLLKQHEQGCDILGEAVRNRPPARRSEPNSGVSGRASAGKGRTHMPGTHDRMFPRIQRTILKFPEVIEMARQLPS